MERFVHLHNHTEYSLLDGGSRIRDLVAKAVHYESPALAITDHGVMYGAIDFYLACKDAGIKPIIGCEIYLARESMHKKEPRFDQHPHHLILLAKDVEGYRNLIKITSKAHLDGFYYKPRADFELLGQYSRGLVAMTACLAGEVPRLLQQGDRQAALEAAKRYQDIFGKDDFYIELQYHENIEGQLEINGRLAELARAIGAPLVCTNDSHYVEKDDAQAHDILLCVQTGRQLEDPNRLRYPDDFSLKSPEQMAREFAEYPESLASSLEIAEKCDLQLDFGTVRLPDYEVPAGENNDSYLAEICRLGLKDRLGDVDPEAQKRLEDELGVISRTGYSQYFLIVYDFVRYAAENGIMTTCRGSAPGSLVTYALGITPINPIKYDIPFERFLNESRVTMPDIDIDFQDNRRDEVIDYITGKYGSDRVAQIITFGTLLARNAVRDVGRVLGIGYGDVDRIAKMIPPGVSLEQAKKDVPQLRDAIAESSEVARLIETARKIEGLPRHASTHAAGIVISADPLTDLVPLQSATKGHGAMTQFHMKNIAQLGLLKFDILGLANLSIIQDAVCQIEKETGERLDINRIPLDDKKTFELLSSGETTGVFQFESPGMRKYLTELRPTEVEDLMAMVALYRPGPMANIPSYIRRKHGKEKVECLHPAMEKVLHKTYGVMVYQEDIMAVAQAIAGYSPTEADSLCAAVRKKKARQLKKHRTTFVEGAKGKGIPAETVDAAFDLFEPFARTTRPSTWPPSYRTR
jgi:DNA polymerase-3 subunit alpha